MHFLKLHVHFVFQICSPLMVLAQRATYVGFSVHDGTASLPSCTLSSLPLLSSQFFLSKQLTKLFVRTFLCYVVGLGRKDADLTEE